MTSAVSSLREPKGHRPHLLSEELVRDLAAAGQADVLVGIPTLDNAGTIAAVVRAVMSTFVGPLARERTLLLAADGGSSDGTPEIVRGLQSDAPDVLLTRRALRTIHRISTPYHGVPGRSGALRIVFAAASLIGARAVVLIDPDAVALTRDGVARLTRAVLDDGFSLVKPVTRRSPWEQPLVTQLAAPLLRAAYGKRLREPVATQFACSGRFAADALSSDLWDRASAGHGVDEWLTTRAMSSGVRIAQVWAPSASEPIHQRRPPAAEVFQQVVGVLFECLRTDLHGWTAIRGSSEIPTLGAAEEPTLTRPPFDLTEFASAFRQGVHDLAPLLEPTIGADDLAAFARAAAVTPLHVAPELWARAVWRAFSASARGALPASQVVASLFPLYLGRVAAFLSETEAASAPDANARHEEVALAFEETKALLVDPNAAPREVRT
jgi:hypothetical protein